jgi:Acetoacetate decarboxylase (ADC)
MDKNLQRRTVLAAMAGGTVAAAAGTTPASAAPAAAPERLKGYDNDASLARGWVQAFPKKIGSIRQTRAFPVDSLAGPVVGKGGKFAAVMSAGGRRLAETTVTLDQTADRLPALTRPIVNLRHFPQLALAGQDTPPVHELTMSVLDNLKMANTWVGSGDLRFFPAPREELADLGPTRVGAGFRGSLSYSVHDLKIL